MKTLIFKKGDKFTYVNMDRVDEITLSEYDLGKDADGYCIQIAYSKDDLVTFIFEDKKDDNGESTYTLSILNKWIQRSLYSADMLPIEYVSEIRE